MKILRQNWIQLNSLLEGHENLQKKNLKTHPLQSAQRGLWRRWCDDLEGWDIIKPSSNASWDECGRGALWIFIVANARGSQMS